MKIASSKSNLIEGINIVQKAVSSKSTLQILEGILIEAGDTLKLTGNNLEIGIECVIEADIREKGSIVINSKMLGEIIRKLPESEVFIQTFENNKVLIECENSRFEIMGLSSEGYPALPQIEKQGSFNIKQIELKEMIRQTIFSASTEESRPILTGCLFELKDENFSIVAIDGFRLALRKTVLENQKGNINVVVPGKTLNEIVKILQQTEDTVQVYFTNNQIMFDLGNCKIISRLLQGEYMNYKNIIPVDYLTKTIVKTNDLLSSIERASLIITSEEKKYPVRFNIEKDSFIITSNTEKGSVREEIPSDMTGNPLSIGFNPKFFIDALKAIDDEAINLLFTNNVGPCCIKPLVNDSYIYMILPVRK